MDLEKFTERSRGFLQAAQTLALRSGHQRLTPEHLLKVLLEDKEGLAANLIRARRRRARTRAGGGRDRARQAAEGRRPRRRPALLAPETARVFDQAEQIAKKAGDSYVTVERLLLALAMASGTAGGQGAGEGRRHAQGLNAAINDLRKGRTADSAERRGPLRRAEEIRPRPHRRRRATASSIR